MQWPKRIGILAILAAGLFVVFAGCIGAPAVNKTLKAEILEGSKIFVSALK